MSCHSYIFFDSEPSLRSLSAQNLKKYKSAFTTLARRTREVEVGAYATLGFRAGTRFMLHLRATEAAELQKFLQSLMSSPLGLHLKITYTLLGMTRPSQYNTKGAPEEKEFKDGMGKYLIVYPFTKTDAWHVLPFEERRQMMKEHVGVARKFSHAVRQLLLYAYGIDDHEFIVSYQTDHLLEFQSLVMELRGTKGRLYTKSDTPIFTGVFMPLPQALDML